MRTTSRTNRLGRGEVMEEKNMEEQTGESLTVQLAEVLAQVEEEKGKAEENLAIAQRTQADFINYKRRVAEEREELVRQANAGLMEDLLPVLDDFERALKAAADDKALQDWVQGVEQIYRKLLAALERNGLQRIECLGEEFDPRYHEAVMYEHCAPENSGKVTEVMQTGYRLNDRVLRPAMVEVGKGPQ